MSQSAYSLYLPVRRTTSAIFASPHSGRDYPPAFLHASVLDERTIRSSEDAFVDRLLESVPQLGAPLLAARAPRAFLDLNRAADELDPAVIEGARTVAHNPRVASGLGVIPRVVAGGRAIYSGKLTLGEARSRIGHWWHPYHERLRALLDESRALFGGAVLFDIHSMPHEAMDGHSGRSSRRPEIVVGDRYGAAAAADMTAAVETAFRARGFRVARNAPFAGAYIAQAYGRPGINQHVIQIEMDRALYMNERTVEPSADFIAFRATLATVLADLADLGRAQPLSALAAE